MSSRSTELSVENSLSNLEITNEDIEDALLTDESAFNPTTEYITTQPTDAPAHPVVVDIKTSPAPISPEQTLSPKISPFSQEFNESDNFFHIRKQYTNLAIQLFPTTDVRSLVVVGRSATNNFYYGVTYAPQIQNLIEYLNNQV